MSAHSKTKHKAGQSLLFVLMSLYLAFGATQVFGQGSTRKYPPPPKKVPSTNTASPPTVIASGEVRPVRYVNIGSEAAGRIQEIYVNPGELVKKNQVLVVIDSSRQAQEKVTQVSPLDGVVADISVRTGDFVVGGLTSTRLMTIADMSRIYVEVNVDEAEISRVEVGQQVRIIVDAFGEKEIRGEVTYKNPRAVSTSNEFGLSNRINVQEAKEFKVTVELRAIPAALRNRLRPGMSATATIATRTKGKPK